MRYNTAPNWWQWLLLFPILLHFPHKQVVIPLVVWRVSGSDVKRLEDALLFFLRELHGVIPRLALLRESRWRKL
jgi:hypothetical protein